MQADPACCKSAFVPPNYACGLTSHHSGCNNGVGVARDRSFMQQPASRIVRLCVRFRIETSCHSGCGVEPSCTLQETDPSCKMHLHHDLGWASVVIIPNDACRLGCDSTGAFTKCDKDQGMSWACIDIRPDAHMYASIN